MNALTVADLLNVCLPGCAVRHASSDPHGLRQVAYLATDSREIIDYAHTVFVAIRTGVNDGRKYISGLAQKGTAVFIVDSTDGNLPDIDATFIIVDNITAALAQMAKKRLEACSSGIVITGSYGKTKTKELLWQLLAPICACVRSPRSWNSAIGVPLAVWNMTADNPCPECIITEAGIDGPGQGEKMAGILSASHRIGIITPITEEHDEAFASHADKIAEKLKIVKNCRTVVYADTDPELRRQLEALPSVRSIAVAMPLPGDNFTIFHALAIAAAKNMPLACRCDTDNILRTQPVDMRRRITTGAYGNNLIIDRYTPDLRSLYDSLLFFRRYSDASRPKALILGRMFNASDDTFRQVSEYASLCGVGIIVSVSGIGADTPGIIAGSADLIAAIDAGEAWRQHDILIFGRDVEAYESALQTAAHDTELEVDLDALIHNYNYYRRCLPSGTGIVAMVKASGYGMGAVQIGKSLQDQGAAYLAVAVVDEGVELRQAGIEMPVMVLNPITNRHHSLFNYHLEPTVFSLKELNELNAAASDLGDEVYDIHIKIDTGMHRVGFLESEIPALAVCLHTMPRFRVASVFTHLATADCADLEGYTRAQIAEFTRVADELERLAGYPIKRHYLNTAGIMDFVDSGKYDMARLGIGLYGVSPVAGGSSLQPVASLMTRIISLRHWPAGTPIGYGCKGHTAHDGYVATIPIGYADGINRHLGNGNANFLVDGVQCPTIGNICMDLCMIDVSGVPGATVGGKVEVFGTNNPVSRLSDALDTIPYEIFTSVSPRVKRTYLKR